MLKEIAAPDGYVIATDIKFTVDVYGNVMVENADAAVIAERRHAHSHNGGRG